MGKWAWEHEARGPAPSLTPAEIFAAKCRQKGTRIDDIMTRIERGESNRDIAERYGADDETIEVYRKALEGRLCDLSSGRAAIAETKNLREERYRQVVGMYYVRGMRQCDIAQALGVTKGTVKAIINKSKRLRGDGE